MLKYLLVTSILVTSSLTVAREIKEDKKAPPALRDPVMVVTDSGSILGRYVGATSNGTHGAVIINYNGEPVSLWVESPGTHLDWHQVDDTVLFKTSNCTGEAFLAQTTKSLTKTIGVPVQQTILGLPTIEWYAYIQASSTPEPVNIQSTIGFLGRCNPYSWTGDAFPTARIPLPNAPLYLK